MDTLPINLALLPFTNTSPKLGDRRNPSAYPTGIAPTRVKRSAINSLPYPTDSPFLITLVWEITVLSISTGFATKGVLIFSEVAGSGPYNILPGRTIVRCDVGKNNMAALFAACIRGGFIPK